MYGRYGHDELSKAISITALANIAAFNTGKCGQLLFDYIALPGPESLYLFVF